MTKKKKIIICISVTMVVLSFVSVLYVANQPYRLSKKLVRAIENEDMLVINKILGDGFDPNTPTEKPSSWHKLFDIYSRVPLSIACRKGNYQIVQVLIQHGATAEYCVGTGWSPLMETLFYYQPEDLEIVELLLANGADPFQEQTSISPVFLASRMVPKQFDSNKTNGTVYNGEYDLEIAKQITMIVTLLLGDQSPNITDGSNETLLMQAAAVGNLYLVDYLLSIGADPTLQDVEGRTAYDYAIQNNQDDVAQLLKKHNQ